LTSSGIEPATFQLVAVSTRHVRSRIEPFSPLDVSPHQSAAHFRLVCACVIPLRYVLLICRTRSEVPVANIRRGNSAAADSNRETTPCKCLLMQLVCLANDTACNFWPISVKCQQVEVTVAYVGFEVLNGPILWDTSIAPCSPYVNRRFGETYHFHLYARKSTKHENRM
jgi:hypothetical protein